MTKPCAECGETFSYRGRNRAIFCSMACRRVARARDSLRRTAKWRRLHPDATHASERRSRLQRMYGLAPDRYEAMVVAQGGACAICGSVPERLTVDHDHGDGHVRGLLCASCNGGIGKLKDDPELLLKAARYLKADLAAL
jgi:hypothetical protein